MPVTRSAEGRKPVASSQQPARSRRPQPVLITEAQLSREEQHAARKKRYVLTMAVRAVSLILAAVFYQTLWLALIFAALGTVLPWIAVMMANDRPPKKKLDVHRYSPPRPDRILENPARSGRVIEH
jgi:Flp pilus assembly protein TadB